MAAVTIRNLSDEAHRALKVRAKQKGKSTEAEMRTILEEAANPPERLKLGTELAKLRVLLDGVELDIRRDKTPIEAANFD